MLSSLRLSLLWLCAVCLAIPLFAQEPAPADDPAEEEVTVVVTADRVLQPISQTIATTAVITAKEIRESGAQTVADALRIAPGVGVRQSGQVGALATTSVRGSSSNQVLVLVDGQRVSSPAFFSGTDLAKFPVTNVARIEIIRGPASSLYGSEAFGGVINIITKSPGEAGGEVTYGHARNGRAERALRVQGSAGPLNWQLNGAFPGYDGIRPNSDFSATDLSARVVMPDLAGWNLSLRGNTYHDKLGLPNADPNHTGFFDPDDRQWWDRNSLDLTGTRALGSGELELRASHNMQRLFNHAPGDWGTYDSDITGVTKTVEALYHVTRGAHQLAFGGEYRNDEYDDIESGASPSEQHEAVYNRAVYLQDRWSLSEATDLVLGGRLDDHATAGSKLTPRVGINHRLGSGLRLRASYAEGFRAPNFVELYYPAGPWGPGYSGNTGLKPETSRQYELGINRHWAGNDVDLAVFTTNVTNLIQATSATPYENVGRTRQRGIELSWQRRLGGNTALECTFSHLNAVNRTTGARLLGQPNNKATVTVSTRVRGVWDVALTGRWTDDRPDLVFDPETFSSNPVTIPDFMVFDLTLTRQGTGNFQPYFILRNLLDRDYEEVAGFATEGFGLETGMRMAW